MVDSIKITALQDIGANIAYTTLVPVVNMAGTPTTQKANLQNLGNLILNGAGGSYFARAAQANLALSVANAAQPNITSVGTLTSLVVTGNIRAGNANLGNIATANFYYGDGGFLTNVASGSNYSNSNVAAYLPTYTGNVGAGNVNATGTVYASGISSTGLASLTILNVSTTANLGAVGNVKITGGTSGQKLTTDGAGNLSWTNDANSSYGDSNVVSLLSAFGSNTITTTGNVSIGNANITGLTSLAALTVSTTANLGAVDNITITGGSNGQVLTTNGNGEVSWTTTYGNSNVATFLAAFGSNTITTTGNVSVGNIIGNSTIDVDNRASGNTADIRLFSADDIVLQARDRTLGSTTEGGDVNIYAGDSAEDADSSGGDVQIFAGDGGAGNIDFGGSGGFITIQSGRGGAAIGNSGATAQSGGSLTLSAGDAGDNNGNIDLGADGGDVFIESGFSTGNTNNGGDIVLTTGTGGQNGASGNVQINIPGYGNTSGGIWNFDATGKLTLPNNSNIATIGNITQFNTRANGFLGLNSYDAGGNNVARVNVNSIDKIVSIGLSDPITEIDYNWSFDDTGNLTLPGNTFAVNYANGTAVSIGGGGANTGNVTFSNNIVIGTGDEFGSAGLFLAPGNGSIANSAVQYLRVRGGDAPTHIHLDTGNNQFYDQYFGDDAKYVKLELGDAGNVVVGTDDAAGNSYNWTFTSDGNFILANGNSVIQSIANSSLDPINPNVSTMVLTPDPGYSSQSLVLDPTAPGHIHLRAPSQSGNIDIPAANIFLGGEDTSFEVTVGANNYAMIHSGGNTWTFGADGNLNFPRDVAGNSDPYLSIAGGATPTIQSTDASLAGPANLAIQSNYLNLSGFSGDKIVFYADTGEMATDANMTLTTNLANTGNTSSWVFGTDGNLTIPGTSGGFIKTVSNASIGIAAMDNGTNNPAQLLSMNVGNGNATSIVSAYSTNVAIQTNAAGAINTWAFDNAGNLTLPGSLIAITASPSPTINGFSITNSMGISGNGNISTAGTITATGKIGYSTGGNATQSSTGQGVTVNQLTGLVTLASRTYNAGDLEAFSISCNKVSNDDFVLVQMVDSVNAPSYNVVAYPNTVLANTISVLMRTLVTVGTDTPILKFMVVKAPLS